MSPVQDNDPPVDPRPPAGGPLGPYGSWPYVERRVHSDRRAGPTRLFSRYMLTGRRAVGRRKGERQNLYVDRYAPHDLTLVLAILILNVADAYFTLDYLGRGGGEANPVARQLIALGAGWFLFSKAVVVGICLLFLLLHKTFKFVRPALFGLLTFYGVLLVYHLYLQVDLWLASPRGP